MLTITFFGCVTPNIHHDQPPYLIMRLLTKLFSRLGTANSTANLLDDVEGNPCGKMRSYNPENCICGGFVIYERAVNR